METINAPFWMNVVSLPIIIAIALGINALTAAWMQPYVTYRDGNHWEPKRTFWFLTLFSALIAVASAVCEYFQTNVITTAVIVVLAFVSLVKTTKLPESLWLVAAAICFPTFFIGEVAIEQNVFTATLLTFFGITAMTFMSLFYVMGGSLFPDKKNND